MNKKLVGAPLSPAETRIVNCVVRGLSNKETAQVLGIHPHSVSNQLNIVYFKMQVRNRVELTLKVIEKQRLEELYGTVESA